MRLFRLLLLPLLGLLIGACNGKPISAVFKNVYPNVMKPGGLIYISGKNFREPASVTLIPIKHKSRGRRIRLKIISVTNEQIVARIPGHAKPSQLKYTAAISIGDEDPDRFEGSRELYITHYETPFLGEDKLDQGLIGRIYKIRKGRKKLPEFTNPETFHAEILAPQLNVEPRSFRKGFPGAKEVLIEWFAVRFEGFIEAPESGLYHFGLKSDDGSRLYINGQKVVDNDGTHPPVYKQGKLQLKAGLHPILVEYFQGPRYGINLQLYWLKPGMKKKTLVPAKRLFMPSR